MERGPRPCLVLGRFSPQASAPSDGEGLSDEDLYPSLTESDPDGVDVADGVWRPGEVAGLSSGGELGGDGSLRFCRPGHLLASGIS